MNLDKRLLVVAAHVSAAELSVILSLPPENQSVILDALMANVAPKRESVSVPAPVETSQTANAVSYRSVKTGAQLASLMESLGVSGPLFASYYGCTVPNVYQLHKTRAFREGTTKRIGDAFAKILDQAVFRS